AFFATDATERLAYCGTIRSCCAGTLTISKVPLIQPDRLFHVKPTHHDELRAVALRPDSKRPRSLTATSNLSTSKESHDPHAEQEAAEAPLARRMPALRTVRRSSLSRPGKHSGSGRHEIAGRVYRLPAKRSSRRTPETGLHSRTDRIAAD